MRSERAELKPRPRVADGMRFSEARGPEGGAVGASSTEEEVVVVVEVG